MPLKKKDKNDKKSLCKQESSKAKDWVGSWRTCSGDGAIKKDGTLWQLGEVGGCNWGQMLPPSDPKTGKPTYTTIYTYHLKPKKIGNGFDGAKIINGGYQVYAIKKDGTLWGWGKGLNKKSMLLSSSHDWVDFGIRWEGNGCCGQEVGLKKDGSLWIIPELFDFAKKSPKDDVIKVKKQKDWDKVILDCCKRYAMKKDGSLWINRNIDSGNKFVKFDHKVDCAAGGDSFCKKLKTRFNQMPSQSIYNYNDSNPEKIDVGSSVGTLCVKPEVKYIF